VAAPSTNAATHAATVDRTRCGFLTFPTDVPKPGCATVTCYPCLNDEAPPTAKVDRRRTRVRRGTIRPEDLTAWAACRATQAITTALTSREPEAVARALRFVGLTGHGAVVLTVFSSGD
jgi:hypothetical protein